MREKRAMEAAVVEVKIVKSGISRRHLNNVNSLAWEEGWEAFQKQRENSFKTWLKIHQLLNSRDYLN